MAELLPAENLALTVARNQVGRGENPELGVTTMLVLALDRLTGHRDWREVAPAPPSGTDGDAGEGEAGSYGYEAVAVRCDECAVPFESDKSSEETP